MAISQDTIVTWLNQNNINYEIDEDKILFTIKYETLITKVKILLPNNGKIFQIYMNLIYQDYSTLTLEDNEYKKQIMQYIMRLNYDTKYGIWEYDLNSGDIRVGIEMILEDALMTNNQFHKILEYFYTEGKDGFVKISQILEDKEKAQKEWEDWNKSIYSLMQPISLD